MLSARTLVTVLLFVAAAPAVFAQRVQNQPPKTAPKAGIAAEMPVPIGIDGPGSNTVDDVRKWLAGFGTKVNPKDLDPKMLKDLMEKLAKNQKTDQKQMEEMLKNNPEFRKQLEQLLKSKDFPQNLDNKLLPDEPRPTDPQLKDKLQQLIDASKKHSGLDMPKDVVGPKGDGLGPNLPKDGPDPSAIKSAAADNQWVKWMEKNFGKSPAADGAVNDLVSALQKQKGKGGLFDDVPEFKNGGWKDINNWGKSNAGDLWKMKPPNLQGGNMNGPKIGGGGNGGGSALGGGGGPSFGGGGGGAGIGGGGTALAVFAAIAAGIFLAVLLLRKWKLSHEHKAANVATGHAGIDFDSIKSREQLVRVFDAVSLDQCGLDARPWNHRVIADHLAKVKPTNAEPADAVAGLYERARYAPLDEDLTTGEFADARRDLRVLAGATA